MFYSTLLLHPGPPLSVKQSEIQGKTFAWWQTFLPRSWAMRCRLHGNRSDPTGVGVQSLPQIEPHGDGAQPGSLERPRSMGRDKDFFTYKFGNFFHDELEYTPERKMKFASVLEQGDESEFVIEAGANKASYYSKYVEKVGGLPCSRCRRPFDRVGNQ